MEILLLVFIIVGFAMLIASANGCRNFRRSSRRGGSSYNSYINYGGSSSSDYGSSSSSDYGSSSSSDYGSSSGGDYGGGSSGGDCGGGSTGGS